MNGDHGQASLEHSMHGQTDPDPVDTGSLKWEVGISADNYHVMYGKGVLGESREEPLIFLHEKF